MSTSTSEARFNEGLGKKFMKDGKTVRCQGVSKTKLRRIRVEQNNPDLKSADVWPDGQCAFPAVPGTFLCPIHGGRSLGIKKKFVTDFMPVDLQGMAKTFLENPNLADRREAIVQLQARNAQLFERLHTTTGGKASIDELLRGLQEIEKGDIAVGAARIRAVVEASVRERETWEEIRANQEMERKQVLAQAELYKTMKTMATAEQVTALVQGMYKTFFSAVETNVDDPAMRDRILRIVSADLMRRANVTSVVSGLTNDYSS